MAVYEQQTLLTETRRLLRARKQTLAQIHSATGLPFHWLQKMRDGVIRDPSVNRIQKLYEFLAGRPLV